MSLVTFQSETRKLLDATELDLSKVIHQFKIRQIEYK